MDLNRSLMHGIYRNLKEKFLSSYVLLKKKLVSEYGEPELEESKFSYTCTWKLKQTNIMLSFSSDDMTENYINLVLSYSYYPELKEKTMRGRKKMEDKNWSALERGKMKE
jgi:hypothetical protein